MGAAFRIMQVDSGPGDDRLDLPGSFYNGYTYVDLGAGRDTLKLGATWDASVEVRGGEGDDTIEDPGTPGGYYFCGAGTDVATPDETEELHNCEGSERPRAPLSRRPRRLLLPVVSS